MRFGFVFENTVGHVTFAQTLADVAAGQPDLEAVFLPISVPERGLADRVPVMRTNWSLHASTHARALFSRAPRRRFDALLFHTQTATLLSVGVMRRVPSLISMDATPRNFDEVGAGYGHEPGSPLAERLKLELVRRPLLAAAGVVAWSDWVRRSLIDEYRVPPERIDVVPAGTDLSLHPPVREGRRPGPLRLLFVGGAFGRKGGPVLLEALAHVHEPVELDVVTQEDVDAPAWARIHRGIRPGDPRLTRLYADADLFVLPTTGDASPHVLLEAMAAGLPVVTTGVGAIPEVVLDGVTGRIVPAGDARGLAAALAPFVADPTATTALGRAARLRVEERFDARRNVGAVLASMRRIAAAQRI